MINMRKKSTFLFLLAICFFGGKANAQLSTNPDKFLGNITTRYNVDAGGGVDSDTVIETRLRAFGF